MNIEDRRYKVFGMVTNMDWEGERLIHWLHERCGKSEEAHVVMKDDLDGGKLLSDYFGKMLHGGGFWFSSDNRFSLY